ncbi:peroxidase family protein [Bradyrhizobium sp.]|uniref:peroxidase family protein n=1 Tax=Bradyrhizobium sp. TaxID=376 RepID=UPI00238A3CF8|nr:peroxidase family protein [Bradyrhizobium sp.]MDE2377710.1 heme peroxidase [Bradyrhizobium sp.]
MFELLPSWIVRLVAWLAARWPALARFINRLMINATVNVSRNRPHPWSTVHDYTSWRSLTDTSFSARHLPAVHMMGLPDSARVVEIFRRPAGQQRLSAKSTCLFPAFAQYLTDGFIRTRMPDTSEGEPQALRLQNTSNHQIDLCPLYGRTLAQTDALRLKSQARGERGRLKSQQIRGEEYAPFLYPVEGNPDPEFSRLDQPLGISPETDPALRARLFAFGGDRANATPQVAMLNTLLLREHNRLAGLIERDHGDWDDERVFQVARNTLIAIFIKIVVEEYINHIAPSPFRFSADATVGYKARWYRTNWITTEFSLLYRWHSLLPDQVQWDGALRPLGTTLFNNGLMLARGLVESFSEFAGQPAAQLGPFNSADVLLPVEQAGIEQGRTCAIGPYGDYREYVGLKRPESFQDVTSNPRLAELLGDVYGSPDRIEFYPGLFCEDTVRNSPLPPLILRMVAVDAFSQALTNPLLSEHVFNLETFSSSGWRAIQTTSTIADLLDRNAPGGLRGARVSMTQPGWQYEW